MNSVQILIIFSLHSHILFRECIFVIEQAWAPVNLLFHAPGALFQPIHGTRISVIGEIHPIKMRFLHQEYVKITLHTSELAISV